MVTSLRQRSRLYRQRQRTDPGARSRAATQQDFHQFPVVLVSRAGQGGL